MNIRTSILYISSSLIFLTSLSSGSDHTHGDMQTPQRSTLLAQTAAETPGMRISSDQARIYKEDRFIDVLGDDFDELLLTIHEEKDEAIKMFRLFQSTSISYADHRKSYVSKMVRRFNDHYKKPKTDAYKSLFFDVLQLEDQKRTLPLNRIEESTINFFERMYPNCNIKLTYKTKGVQLGTVAKVKTSDGRELDYYVKTHSGGLISANSASAKIVSPQELMVYKILELLGIGCESYFFGRDGRNMYVATLSAKTEGEFKEYGYFSKSKTEELICGVLADLPKEGELDHAKIEAAITSNSTSKMFIHEMSKIDLLARILRLTDFQTNTDNYGFLRLENGVTKIKALDFRLISTEPEELMLGDHFFKAFENGNGLYHYPTADRAMCYVLRHRQKNLRVLEARAIINEEFLRFESIIEEAKMHVKDSLSRISIPSEERDKIQIDLNKYSEVIKHNFQCFKYALTH